MGYNRSHREGLNSATETDSNRTTTKGNNMKDGKIELPVTAWESGYITDASGGIISVKTLADLINAGASAPKWQQIETAPRDGSFVLVCWEGSPESAIVAWADDSGAWVFEDEEQRLTPSHWMPLPEPSEAEPEPEPSPGQTGKVTPMDSELTPEMEPDYIDYLHDKLAGLRARLERAEARVDDREFCSLADMAYEKYGVGWWTAKRDAIREVHRALTKTDGEVE